MADINVILQEEAVSQENAVRSYCLARKAVLCRDKRYWHFRRAQDVSFSPAVLLAPWSVLALSALMIWIDSPGASLISVQSRMGRDGKPLNFYNLRRKES